MEQIIETTYGKVSGITKNGCREYLGIPYAKAPVSDLAFRHPEDPDKWDGVLKADKGGRNAIQGYSSRHYISYTGQDCLYMNICVPEGEEKVRPVLVWIHGGSYATGGTGRINESSDDMVYDLTRFAKETDAVLVDFNYRLNLYGFMNLNHLSDRFDVNCGLFDQIKALEFIKNNISAFGGDPDNITLFGQSSGAACILALMTMPEAKPLFAKSIVQSACVDSFWTPEQSRKITGMYMRMLGISKKTPEKILTADPVKVYRANRKIKIRVRAGGEVTCVFSPVLDGKTVKDYPGRLVVSSDKPMLIGTCLHEANLFTDKFPTFLLPYAPRLFKLKTKWGKNLRQRLANDLTEKVYKRPVEDIASSYAGNVWLYDYQYAKACRHADEVPVLFGSKTEPGRDARSPENNKLEPDADALGITLRKVWGDFAHKGEPGWGMYKDSREIHIFK
ncbi:MAG: carboxylesterase/lipase family protein [Clostridiales bacterium]|nr:carboxylesterase/lipase family protein [Clostridiales bacterium]